MNTDDRISGRWIGLVVGAALVLSACSSTSSVASPTDEVETSPIVLPLDETTSADAVVADASFDVADFDSLADLENVELTPELFEELKTNEVSREAIIVEMGVNGLTPEESVCFLDTVSPGLFISFGTGEQPDDAQFAELLELLDTCEIAFGTES